MPVFLAWAGSLTAWQGLLIRDRSAHRHTHIPRSLAPRLRTFWTFAASFIWYFPNIHVQDILTLGHFGPSDHIQDTDPPIILMTFIQFLISRTFVSILSYSGPLRSRSLATSDVRNHRGQGTLKLSIYTLVPRNHWHQGPLELPMSDYPCLGTHWHHGTYELLLPEYPRTTYIKELFNYWLLGTE